MSLKKCANGAAAALLLCLPATSHATGQGQKWACEWGMYTQGNRNAGEAGGAFVVFAYGDGRTPSGRAEGQGHQGSGYGREPVVFEGNWRLDGRAFTITGVQSINGGPAQRFSFTSNLVSNNEMAMTANMGGGQVIATRCLLQGTF